MRKFISALLCFLLVMPAMAEEQARPILQEIVMPVQPVANDAYGTENADAFIVLMNDSAQISGEGASFESGILSITKSGTYCLTGTLSGSLFVNSSDEEKITLIFNGVSVTNADGSCLVILSSGKNTTLTLAKDSVNLLSAIFPSDILTVDGAHDAAIYTKADLKIKGDGALYIEADGGKGINCRDDLSVKDASVYVNATDNGICGKDSVTVSSGYIRITSGADGLKSTNEEKVDKGTVTISGGCIEIDAQNDAVQAYNCLRVTGGEITCICGGGAGEETINAESAFGPGGGFPGGRGGGFPGGKDDRRYGAETSNDTQSAKGLKSSTDIQISGGNLVIDTLDDAIHSDQDITVSGGTLTLTTGDDGIHADNALYIQNGSIEITQSFEGIEAADLQISGGNIRLRASDDGVNAAGGAVDRTASYGGGGRGFGGGMMSSSSGSMTMTGGYLVVISSGDGVDVNGSTEMTGGTLIIYGPTNGANAALDYDGAFTVSGGMLLATGSAGMAQAVSTADNMQMLAFTCGMPANTILHIADGDDLSICTFISEKDYSCVIFVSELIKTGKSYQVYAQGEYSLPAENGLYTNGEYTPGTLLGTIDL